MKKRGGRDLFLRLNPLPAALFSSDFYEGLCFYFDLYERLSVSISWIEQILLPFEKSFSFLLFLKFLDITLPPILVGIGNFLFEQGETPFSRIGNLKRIVFPLFTPLGGTAKAIGGFLEGCSTLLLSPFSSLWERIPPLLLWGEQILPPLLRLGGELLFLLKEGGEILFFSASSLLLLLVEGGSLSSKVISSFLTSLFLTLNGLEYPLRNLLSIAGGDGTFLRPLFHSLHPTVQHWFSPLLPLLRGIEKFLQEGVFGDRLGVRGLDLLLRGVGFSTTLLLLYSSLHKENRSFYRGMSEQMLRIRAQQDVHCDIFMLAKVKGELYRERLRLGKSSGLHLFPDLPLTSSREGTEVLEEVSTGYPVPPMGLGVRGTDSASLVTEMQDFLYNIAQREILRERGELGGEVCATATTSNPSMTSDPVFTLYPEGGTTFFKGKKGLVTGVPRTSSLLRRDEVVPLRGKEEVTPLNILEEVWEFERSRIMKRGAINPPSAEEAQAAIYKTIERSLSHLEKPTRQIFEGDGNPPFRVEEGFSANVMALWIDEQMITSRGSDEYEEALLKQFRGVSDYQTNLFKWEDEEIERLSHLQFTLQQKAREDERELTERFKEKERNFRKALLRETVEQGETLLAESKYLLEQRKQVREEREEFLKERKRWRDKVLQQATEEIENNERLRRAYFQHVYKIMHQDIEVEKWKVRNVLVAAEAGIHRAEILNERAGALRLASTERIKMWMYNADIKLQNWRMREQKLLRQHYRMGTMDEVERQTGILKALFQEEKKRMEGERDELVQLYIQRLMEVKRERDEALSRLRPTSDLPPLPLTPSLLQREEGVRGTTSQRGSPVPLTPSSLCKRDGVRGTTSSSTFNQGLEVLNSSSTSNPYPLKGSGLEGDPLYGSGFDTDVKEVCNPLSPQSIPPVVTDPYPTTNPSTPNPIRGLFASNPDPLPLDLHRGIPLYKGYPSGVRGIPFTKERGVTKRSQEEVLGVPFASDLPPGGLVKGTELPLKEVRTGVSTSKEGEFSIPLTGNCRGKWNLLSREKMKLLLKKRESFQYLERGNPLPLPGGYPLWGKEWGDSGGKREDLLFKRVTPKEITPLPLTPSSLCKRDGVRGTTSSNLPPVPTPYPVLTPLGVRNRGHSTEVPSYPIGVPLLQREEREGLITLKWDSNFEKELPSLTRKSPYPLGVTSFEVLGELPPLSSFGSSLVPAKQPNGVRTGCFAGPVRDGAPRREEGDPMGETPCPGSPVTPVRKVSSHKEIQSEEELLIPMCLIPGTRLGKGTRKAIGPTKQVLERYRVPKDEKQGVEVQPLWKRLAEWRVNLRGPKGHSKGGGEGVGLPPRKTPFSDSEWKESVEKAFRSSVRLLEGWIRIMTKPNRDEILSYEGGIERLKEVRKDALKKDQDHWEWYYPLLDDPHMFAEGRRDNIPLCFYESEAKELAEMEFAMKYHSGEGDPPLKGFRGYTLPPLPEPEKDPPGLPPSLPPPVFRTSDPLPLTPSLAQGTGVLPFTKVTRGTTSSLTPKGSEVLGGTLLRRDEANSGVGEENPPQIPNPQPVPPTDPLFPNPFPCTRDGGTGYSVLTSSSTSDPPSTDPLEGVSQGSEANSAVLPLTPSLLLTPMTSTEVLGVREEGVTFEKRTRSGEEVRGVSTRSERAFFGLPQEGADFIYYGLPHIEFIDSHSLGGNTSRGSSVDDFESEI
jgi:hypothetical protein